MLINMEERMKLYAIIISIIAIIIYIIFLCRHYIYAYLKYFREELKYRKDLSHSLKIDLKRKLSCLQHSYNPLV